MSTEAPPRRGRPPRSASFSPEKISDTRVVFMNKGDVQDDYPRLQAYQDMGYEIVEEPWRYKMVCPQEEFDKRQAMYQAKGLARAGKKGVAAQNAADMGPGAQTISQMQQVNVSADDLLAEDETVDYEM